MRRCPFVRPSQEDDTHDDTAPSSDSRSIQRVTVEQASLVASSLGWIQSGAAPEKGGSMHTRAGRTVQQPLLSSRFDTLSAIAAAAVPFGDSPSAESVLSPVSDNNAGAAVRRDRLLMGVGVSTALSAGQLVSPHTERDPPLSFRNAPVASSTTFPSQQQRQAALSQRIPSRSTVVPSEPNNLYRDQQWEQQRNANVSTAPTSGHTRLDASGGGRGDPPRRAAEQQQQRPHSQSPSRVHPTVSRAGQGPAAEVEVGGARPYAQSDRSSAAAAAAPGASTVELQLAAKIRAQAAELTSLTVRLEASTSYTHTLERRLLEISPDHPIPVTEDHLGLPVTSLSRLAAVAAAALQSSAGAHIFRD